MKLEQFKEIADENLRDLYVDERMVSRIHRKLCAVPVRRKARVPARLGPACGGLRCGDAALGRRAPAWNGPAAARGLRCARRVPAVPHNSAVSTLSSSVETSEYIDGSTLSYGVAEVGSFCEEGYAPAAAPTASTATSTGTTSGSCPPCTTRPRTSWTARPPSPSRERCQIIEVP